MKKSDVKIGDRLTVNTSMAAIRMGKCKAQGCALCNQTDYPTYKRIEPGMVGVVARIHCPAVTRNKEFICLDFEIDGHTWRLRPWYHEVKISRT